MSKVISLFNQKGGVGKTTTCANLCACLAALGKKTLAVDFDPQSNLTSGFCIDKNQLDTSVYNVLVDNVDANEAILPTSHKGLDILPSSIGLAGAEIEIANMPQRETMLKRRLEGVIDQYDYVLIDCGPSLGMLPINALAASDSVLIPIQCEYYALEGVSQLMNTVNLVKKSLNPRLEVEGVLLTMHDSRTNLSSQVEDEVRNFFGGKVYEAIIPRNVRLAEAPSYGQTILEYDRHSKGSKAYIDLGKELIRRGEGKR